MSKIATLKPCAAHSAVSTAAKTPHGHDDGAARFVRALLASDAAAHGCAGVDAKLSSIHHFLASL
ncbi:hypothetical protein AAKU55_000304 [Oxalobacteraceae bacterium GrIS 1.11]